MFVLKLVCYVGIFLDSEAVCMIKEKNLPKFIIEVFLPEDKTQCLICFCFIYLVCLFVCLIFIVFFQFFFLWGLEGCCNTNFYKFENFLAKNERPA